MVPMTMTNSIIQDTPIQVKHVVVILEVFVDSLQQQVRTLRG